MPSGSKFVLISRYPESRAPSARASCEKPTSGTCSYAAASIVLSVSLNGPAGVGWSYEWYPRREVSVRRGWTADRGVRGRHRPGRLATQLVRGAAEIASGSVESERVGCERRALRLAPRAAGTRFSDRGGIAIVYLAVLPRIPGQESAHDVSDFSS